VTGIGIRIERCLFATVIGAALAQLTKVTTGTSLDRASQAMWLVITVVWIALAWLLRERLNGRSK
jgi:hypothetical protein